jgi:hypothetical protein
VIVCDTGPLVAAALSADSDHLACVQLFTSLLDPFRLSRSGSFARCRLQIRLQASPGAWATAPRCTAGGPAQSWRGRGLVVIDHGTGESSESWPSDAGGSVSEAMHAVSRRRI